jgi:molybdate transport system substrate-binding protein
MSAALTHAAMKKGMVMTRTSFVTVVATGIAVAVLLPGLSTVGSVASAAEIKVLSAVAFKTALDDLAAVFERSTGHKVTIAYATAGIVRDRIRDGETVDVAIMPRSAFNPLLTQGKIVPGSATVVARSLVALAVPAGAPKPDISSVEALKRALLAAKSIVYPDPTKGGATGIHAARVIERLGITAEMKPRTTLVPGSEYAEILAKGEAEMGIVQPMVVLGVPGVELVGPLPAELQNTTDFVFLAGVGASAKEAEAAKALIKYLVTPAAARVIKAKGMEPGPE